MAPPEWMVRGNCQVCDDKIGPGSFYCALHKDEKERGKPTDEWAHHPGPPPEVIDVEPSEVVTSEKAPASPYAGELEPAPADSKWWRRIGKGKGKAKGAGESKEKTPKRQRTYSSRNRVSAARDFSELYAQLGGRLEGTKHYPAGRMMTYQAEAAGIVFDRAIAGTLPDRVVVQPLVRTKEKWEPLADMVMPPLILVAMANARESGNEQKVAVLANMLEFAIERNLTSMLPAVKQAREEKAKREEAIAEVFPELASARMEDGTPVSAARAIMLMLFEPPNAQQPQESESPDGVPA